MTDSFDHFSCERSYIEKIGQGYVQQVMIETYCTTKFKYINLIDIYYRKLDTNAVLMLLITIVAVSILFMQIILLTNNYIAVGIIYLQQQYEISPKIAALFLIAFLNAAPELLFLTGTKEQTHDAFPFFTQMLGAIIFSTTLGFGFIISKNKEQFI